MALSHPTSLLLQNLWLTFPFWLSFVVLLCVTGAWFGLLLAFVFASIAFSRLPHSAQHAVRGRTHNFWTSLLCFDGVFELPFSAHC